MFVANPFLMQQFDSKAHTSLGDICILMYSYRHIFPNLYSLVVGSITFGNHCALQSIIFDAVKNIDTILQSMTHKQKANFTVMAFIHNYTNNIDND